MILDLAGSTFAQPPGSEAFWNVSLQCPKCCRTEIVELGNLGVGSPTDPCAIGAAVFPFKNMPSTDIPLPEHVDGDIARDFKEALTNLNRGMFTPAGLMVRRVFELTTLALGPESSGVTVDGRIKRLADGSVISRKFQESAYTFQVDGNAAACGAGEEFAQKS